MDTPHDQLGVALAGVATIGLLTSLIWSGYRALKIGDTLSGVMMDTAKTTSLVFIILLGAAILTAAFRAFGGEHLVREFLDSLAGGFWSKFIVVMAVIFVLGFFLDFIEIAVVVVPIVAPILLADPGANVTAVWLGVMIGLNIQTSFLTPPFGFALFYLRGIASATVKTINMYKGVIPFIGLQIFAMVIVATSPSLVNYLPNRVALLSENSPPPRNPQLAHCVDQYVSKEIALNGDQIVSDVEAVRAIDLSILPKKIAKNTTQSFDNVSLAIEQLRIAEKVSVSLVEASAAFRPLHQFVRTIEREIRRNDSDVENLNIELKNLEQGTSSRSYKKQIENLEADREVLIASIPTEWPEKLAEFRDLQKTEKAAYQKYTRSAQSAYQPIAEINFILEANADFEALKGDLMATKGQVRDNEPADMVDSLGALGKLFGRVAGTDDIKSSISKARRALKSRTPSKEKAQRELDKAIAAYQAQVGWRTQGEITILQNLSEYESTMRKTIGIRDQAKLTREQSLFVAKCQSGTRDVSLNF